VKLIYADFEADHKPFARLKIATETAFRAPENDLPGAQPWAVDPVSTAYVPPPAHRRLALTRTDDLVLVGPLMASLAFGFGCPPMGHKRNAQLEVFLD
jgi:hypothetical protein